MNVIKFGKYLVHYGKFFPNIIDYIKKRLNIELIKRPDMK